MILKNIIITLAVISAIVSAIFYANASTAAEAKSRYEYKMA